LGIGLGQTLAYGLARQSLMGSQFALLADEQIQRPAGAALTGFEQAVATRRASSLPANLRAATARFLGERPFQITLRQPPLGSIHRRAAATDAGGDLLVGNTAVRRQQDLTLERDGLIRH